MQARLWSRFGRHLCGGMPHSIKRCWGATAPRLQDSDWASSQHRLALEGEMRAEGDP